MEHSTRFIQWKYNLLNTIYLSGQVLSMISGFGTTPLPIVPNWLSSPLKPRAQLCMEVTSDHDDHQSRIDQWWDKRLDKVQGKQSLKISIEFFCQWLTQEPRLGFSPDSSLGLEKNSIESLLDSSTLYIHNLAICPCYNNKCPFFTDLTPVYAIFLSHGWSDSWHSRVQVFHLYQGISNTR